MKETKYEKDRPAINAEIRRSIEVESGHSCSVKNCNDHTYLEIHHINENREDNNLSNLILLCTKHHKMAHANKIDRKALKEYKKLLNDSIAIKIDEEIKSNSIDINLTEDFKLDYDENDLKSIVQDLIFMAQSHSDFIVNCNLKKNEKNIKKFNLLLQKDLTLIEKEERNFLQQKIKATNEKLLNLNNSIKILFLGCTQNYSKMDFDTAEGIDAIKGLFDSYNNYQGRKKIDIWKDNKLGFSAPIYLTKKEIEVLLVHLNLSDIQALMFGPFYIYEMPIDIRIKKAIPSISREIWYQINTKKRTEEDMMKEYNPSNWKFGLG